MIYVLNMNISLTSHSFVSFITHIIHYI